MTASAASMRRWSRVALLIAFYAVLLMGGRWLGLSIEESLRVSDLSSGMPFFGAIAAVLLAYIVLTAIPFVPGTEIGVALLVLFGAKIAPFVYLATVAALMLAFAVGRLAPGRRLAAWLGRRGLIRAAAVIEAFERLSPRGRDRYLTQTLPSWLKPWLVDHRMITLIVLINLPGNTLVGGGGGIAMMTGLSKLMPFSHFLAAVLVAVAPVPVAVMMAGWGWDWFG